MLVLVEVDSKMDVKEQMAFAHYTRLQHEIIN